MNSSLRPPSASASKPPDPAAAENEARLLAVIGSLEEKQRSLTDQLDSAQASVLELQRSLEHYRSVVEHANEGMIVLKDKRVVYANARAAEISAMPLEEMRKIGFFHRIHPDDRALALDRQRRRLAGKDVASRYELRLLLPPGVIRWISVSVTVAPWDEDQAALVFFSDISHRRGLEEKLRDTLKERETILENSLVGIAFLTGEGIFRWSNREMTRLFGVTRGSKTHTDWRRLFPSQEEYSRVAKDAADCMREGRVYRGDLQMCTLDGKLLWVTATGKAVSPGDETQGSVWAAVDITPRKELEVALARASSEREAIFNSALVGISFNVDRRIQWVNDKYEEMTGYPRAELVGGSTRKFFVDDQTFESESRDTWASLLRDGVYVDERRLLRRDGKILWVQLAGRCVNPHNPDAGVVWTLLDITERHRAEENIRAALEREKELNELRSRFVSMTSHEFRTPLAAILSAAELLKEYSDRMPASERTEILENIGAGVKRMTSMIDRVLLIGQVETHILEFRPAQTDVLALCRKIAQEARASRPMATCEIVTRFAPKSLTGLFDEKLLRHILENLLSNAIKYSADGGQVTFSLSVQAGRTVFEVQDQGIGIPPEELPHLFEPFHRASNVGDIQGTGLGLAIVKKSVELHGGTIEVQSDCGRGTRIVVTI